ncbi:hypothetical protein [Anabaena lutea]|uniref:Uncharacterized protein n=1 Tax=Anabaena lutea FACHB-196 TaxID=2692881 RepID=A0ABR8FMS7_9NOST|nr:hypothetical protein [Anabaena lutea]MBD2570011.1 hypothetical protein [Anabaena lutea FACHB-196]
MATKMLFDLWVQYAGEVMALGETPPDPAKFYTILCDTTPISRDMEIADVIAAELPAVNGYARQAVAFTTGAYNPTNKRYEFPNLNVNFEANSSGSFQFQTMVLLADANSTIGDTTGKLVGFASEDTPVTIFAGQTQPFIIPFVFLNAGYVSGT